MGILNGLKGLDHRELLHRLEDTPLASQSRGVDQAIPNTLPLKRNLNGISGGAGHVKGNDPLLSQQGIHQGGLAHIGAAHDGHTQPTGWHAQGRIDFIVGGCGSGLLDRRRQPAQCGLDEAVNTIAVGARHRQRLTEPKLIELPCASLSCEALELVHGQHSRPTAPTQLLGNLKVLGGHAGPAIDHEDHHVRLRHSLQALPCHLGVDA